MPETLDAVDRRILRALQRNGRMSNVELANEVGLSPSPCLRRVKLLEEKGIIDQYVAVLNGPKIGLGLTVFVRVWFKTQDAAITHQFAETVRDTRVLAPADRAWSYSYDNVLRHDPVAPISGLARVISATPMSPWRSATTSTRRSRRPTSSRRTGSSSPTTA